MKKSILCTIVFAIVYMTTYSQGNTEEIDYYQSIFGMEKKNIVSLFVEVEGAAAQEFWTLYDEYEIARKEFGKKRLELMESYAENYLTMDDPKTDELIMAMATQKKSLDKLIVKYYKKMKKSAGVKPAAQFYQLENWILSAIRLEILENIPFVGEI
jgi:hypothetical protein